jgi:thiosulfate/3-mercaptopyruvate sulfurtransferase
MKQKEKAMKHVIAILLVVLVSASCANINRTAPDEILVDGAWIEENNPVILFVGGSVDDFTTEHIPGAVYFDRTIVWDTVDGLNGMLPAVEQVEQDFQDLGIENDRPVLVYDQGNGLWASRVFWALEYLGHEQAHILNGGLAVYKAAGFPLASGAVLPEPGDFKARVQEDLIADISYVEQAFSKETVGIIDTRSLAEYRGEDVRAERGGHIPGALHIEWTENLQEDQSFLEKSELSSLYKDSPEELITLCQTGVRGAHSYVALRVAGYENVRLYDGSWLEWGNSDLPIETGL